MFLVKCKKLKRDHRSLAAGFKRDSYFYKPD